MGILRATKTIAGIARISAVVMRNAVMESVSRRRNARQEKLSVFAITRMAEHARQVRWRNLMFNALIPKLLRHVVPQIVSIWGKHASLVRHAYWVNADAPMIWYGMRRPGND